MVPRSVELRGALRQMTVAFVCIAAIPAALVGQRAQARVIRGNVVDSTGAPIAYSNILVDNWTRLVADDSGRFTVNVDSGRVLNMTVRRLGYRERSVALTIAQDTTLVITLAHIPQTLAGQEIMGENRMRSLEIHGFYRRLTEREAGAGSGYFITPEEIEQRRPFRATQLLEGVPGIRMNRAGVFWVPLGLDRCPMTVYLDRLRVNSLSNRGSPVFIDEIVTSTALAGMEIYTSAVKAPPEFQALNGTCGVILLWTK